MSVKTRLNRRLELEGFSNLRPIMRTTDVRIGVGRGLGYRQFLTLERQPLSEIRRMARAEADQPPVRHAFLSQLT